jgi:UDP-glucose 4-epimerase
MTIHDNFFSVVVLRYFNVAGAHHSKIIGENPKYNADNLFPSIINSLKSKLKLFKIFGRNCLTPDGTPVRDYVHVMDIAKAHLKALNFIRNRTDLYTFNLGTNKGTSVLSIIKIFEKIHKKN